MSWLGCKTPCLPPAPSLHSTTVPTTAMPPSGLQRKHAGGFGPCGAKQDDEMNNAVLLPTFCLPLNTHIHPHHSLAATCQCDYFKLN